MKASEALLLGSVGTTQGFGIDSFNSLDTPCALGTMAFAIGDNVDRRYDRLEERFPILTQPAQCPLCSYGDLCYNYNVNRVLPVIYHLNDTHYTSRPQIAQYLQRIEEELEGGEHHEVSHAATVPDDAVRV